MHSFIDVLDEAPILLDSLTPEALKALSATCTSLRTLFCAQVKVISLSDVEDASKICGTTWPQLLMVVYNSEPKLASKLSAEWECMMEMSLCSRSRQQGPWVRKTAGLVQARQQMHTPLMGLAEQHLGVLSVLADKHRHTAQELTLKGPLVAHRVVQTLFYDVWPKAKFLCLSGSPQLAAESMSCLKGSLPSLINVGIVHCATAAAELLKSATAWPQMVGVGLPHNQLDATAISILTQAEWTHLRLLALDNNTIGASGVQHLVACSWPSLDNLSLANTGMNETALRCLAEGQWPKLQLLDLSKNNICARGISYLTQGSWPVLRALMLSEPVLDEEACSLLSIAHPATSKVLSYKSGLVQFELLSVWVL